MEPSSQVIVEHDGARVPTFVYLAATTPRPAVVVSPEAYGINEFTKRVASELARAGYVVVVPDYYRGNGPTDCDNYGDFAEVMQFIDELDFTAATHDVMAAIDYARGLPEVDASRVVV